MLFQTLTLTTLLTSVLASAEPAPYQLIGKMSLNNAFGLVNKRQSGYQPTQTYCGPGTDCPTSCGATYIQCASTDGALHCYDPTIKQSCCPDGTGNSCDDGYYCTSDSTGGTWCCPDGMSLSACAAAYSLTDSLVSETATSTPSAAASSSTPAPVSVTTTKTTSTTSVPTTTPTTTKTTTTTPPPSTKTHGGNGTVTTTSSSTPVQVTNGAGAMAVGGLEVLALAVGGLLAL